MATVHDLRTLNALHTEKFLQRCKVAGAGPPEEERSRPLAPPWEVDRDSTGDGSPPSSDARSSSSAEDNRYADRVSRRPSDPLSLSPLCFSSRRSPPSSVSSSESIGPSEVPLLTGRDLRVNGSVLVNALTAPAAASACATLFAAAGGIGIGNGNGNGTGTGERRCPYDAAARTDPGAAAAAAAAAHPKAR